VYLLSKDWSFTASPKLPMLHINMIEINKKYAYISVTIKEEQIKLSISFIFFNAFSVF